MSDKIEIKGFSDLEKENKKNRINSDGSCFNCGTDLNPLVMERPNVDMVKIVCSDCGSINITSIIALYEKGEAL